VFLGRNGATQGAGTGTGSGAAVSQPRGAGLRTGEEHAYYGTRAGGRAQRRAARAGRRRHNGTP